MSLALSWVTLQSPGRVQLTGHGTAMSALRRQIEQIAPTSARVMITGESGAGKGLVARTIHSSSTRSQQSFELVSCAGLVEPLLETELFGGVGTGQPEVGIGHIEAAHRGTLFLDDVGELPLRLQTRFLRCLETGELQNGRQSLLRDGPDVRVIASTRRSLPAMIEAGSFLAELYYRLNVVHMHVPPLRERAEDIPALAEYFLQQFATAHNVAVRQMSAGAADVLSSYRWPGNVRELENIIERAVLTGRGPITPADLPDEIRFGTATATGPAKPTRVVDELYRAMVERQESFWTAVYPRFMHREITRDEVRELVRRSLLEARGNYRVVAQMFNMSASEYKRFLNFLKQHDCHVPYQQYRRGKRAMLQMSMPDRQ